MPISAKQKYIVLQSLIPASPDPGRKFSGAPETSGVAYSHSQHILVLDNHNLSGTGNTNLPASAWLCMAAAGDESF